jgi:leukotriene-A4 hydrolase
MKGIDPDDAFSRIPYEKGCLLLIYLESRVGGIDNMIEWLHKYFRQFARQSIDNAQMIQHFEEHFGKQYNIDWNTWLYGEGLGPWNPMEYLDQTLNKRTQALSQLWLEKGGEGASANDIKWDATMTMVFLDNLINDGRKIDNQVLKKLDVTYQLSQNKNVEVLVRYLRLCLANDFIDIMPDVEKFVARHGRGVYVKPLYKQFIELADKGVLEKARVKEIYQKNRSYYHSVIRNMFDAALAQ